MSGKEDKFIEFREAMFKVHNQLGVSTDQGFVEIAEEMYSKIDCLREQVRELEAELKLCAIHAAVVDADMPNARERLDNVLTGIAEAEDQDTLWGFRLGETIIQCLQGRLRKIEVAVEKMRAQAEYFIQHNTDTMSCERIIEALTTALEEGKEEGKQKSLHSQDVYIHPTDCSCPECN